MLFSALGSLGDRFDAKFITAYFAPAFVAVLGTIAILVTAVGGERFGDVGRRVRLGQTRRRGPRSRAADPEVWRTCCKPWRDRSRRCLPGAPGPSSSKARRFEASSEPAPAPGSDGVDVAR